MRVGQQMYLACTLETIGTDMRCIQDTQIQDSSSVILLTPLSNPSVKLHAHLSGDPETAASDVAIAGVAYSGRVDIMLLACIPISNRFCTASRRRSSKVNNRHSDKQNLSFGVCNYRPDPAKEISHQQLHDLLEKVSQGNKVLWWFGHPRFASLGIILRCQLVDAILFRLNWRALPLTHCES